MVVVIGVDPFLVVLRRGTMLMMTCVWNNTWMVMVHDDDDVVLCW